MPGGPTWSWFGEAIPRAALEAGSVAARRCDCMLIAGHSLTGPVTETLPRLVECLRRG